MCDQWTVRERLSGNSLNQSAGRKLAAVPVDIDVEPLPQRREVAPGEERIEVSERLAGRLEKLSRVHISQRVGRKIAEQSRAPVHVLQTPLGIIRRRDAQ